MLPSDFEVFTEKGHSIYIGDLPWDATTELVEQEFKKFGRIKRNGIQVRSNKVCLPWKSDSLL